MSVVRTIIVLLLYCMSLNGVLAACNGSTFCVCENSTADCPPEQCCECHPLQWYVNHSAFVESNSTLLYLPGKHKLQYNTALKIEGVSNIVMEGMVKGMGNNKPSIVCSQIGGVSFSNVTDVNITNIAFNNCGIDVHYEEHFTVHAGVSFLSCSNIILSNVVINNSTGYGLHVDRVYGFIKVLGSIFQYSRSSKEHRCSANARFYYGMDSTKGSNLFIDNSSFLNGYSRNSDEQNPNDTCRYRYREPYGSGLVVLIYAPSIRVTMRDVVAKNNSANTGANLAFVIMYFHENTSTISISDSLFSEGHGGKGAGLMGYIMLHDTNATVHTSNNNKHNLVSIDNVSFSNNTGGGVYIHLKQLNHIDPTVQTISFKNCIFVNNTGYRGVAVTIMKILVPELPPNNAALVQFTVSFQNCIFSQNGGKTENKLDESVIMMLKAESVVVNNCTFNNNSVTGISLINSNLHLTGYVHFENNNALYGGALSLWDSSIIYITPPTHVTFINNHAKKMGGAIFIEQRQLDSDPPCFYQPLVARGHWNKAELAKKFKFQYAGNKALIAGDALYGGGVEYCFFMLHYFKLTSTEIFPVIHNLSSQMGPSIVASDPLDVLFCNSSTNMPIDSTKNLDKCVYPGETLKLFVSAVGQLNGAVPSLISVRSTNRSEKVSPGRLNSTRNLLCHWIKVEIFTKSPLVTLELTVDAISATSNFALSSQFKKKKTKVRVSIKECPWIFKSNLSSGCDCNPLIKKHAPGVSCNINKISLKRDKNIWIGCTYSGINSTEIHSNAPCSLIQVTDKCPSEYCSNSSVSINSSNVDQQCQEGREGVLCGKCKENYSLSLGEEKCISNNECSSWMLVLLLLVFVLAGIFLVFSLALLNFTVTQGTMYGLLCYVSMVHANHKVILEPGHRTVSIIIAWLNLDFGINVCLYSGMNAYQKIWLEFSFVVYLLFLSLAIIFLSRKFIYITRLVGRNVVSVISTILVLSYSKIARISIKALRNADLHVSGDKTLTVWYYDGNIQYFSGKHIPLAVVAITMLFIISLYTMALLFIQCLQRRSNWCMLRWVNKLRPFFDANTGPCRDHYRFWPGFLLSCLLAIFALQVCHCKPESQLYIGLAFCVFVFILACISPHGVYKKWPLNVLEFSFFLNLGFLTSLVPILKDDVTRVATASVSIAILTFALIILFHCYQKISSTKKWVKLISRVKGRRFKSRRFLNINTKLEEEYDEIVQAANEHAPLLTTPTYCYNNRLRETLLSDEY